ncbi:MAG: phosphatase PAP2 family protein [Fluviicola sp.]
MSLKTRLCYLVISWLSCGLIYIASGFVKGTNWIIPETPIDQFIPFNPQGIWLYLGFYVYIPYTFITVKESLVKRITFAFVITACISGVLFFCLPSSIVFPAFKNDGLSASLLAFISENDTEQNCFPSMHASLITLCLFANWDRKNWIRTITCTSITLLMYYCIIAVRRHVFIDLAAGIVLASLVWLVSGVMLRNSTKPNTSR